MSKSKLPSHFLVGSPPYSRMGGGGEPLRRQDGTIVTNLRTFERTANPNLPFDRDAAFVKSQQRSGQVPRPSEGLPVGGGLGLLTPEPTISGVFERDSTDHMLFNHAYDSPEEKESLFLKRQRQRDLRAVLESQVREKEERRRGDKLKREEEDRYELELELGSAQFPSSYPHNVPMASTDMRALKSSSSPMMLTSDGGSGAVLGDLLSSPIHARLNRDDGIPSANGKDYEELKEEHIEREETLLRTIKDQGAEIEKLTQQLQGLQEGRNLFSTTIITPRNPDSSIYLVSPMKRSHITYRVAHGEEDYAPPDSTELKSTSQYFPVGHTSSLVTSTALEIDEIMPSPDKKAVVSSTLLQSSFGLTPFEKSYKSNQYESRNEEALESFLRAFQQLD